MRVGMLGLRFDKASSDLFIKIGGTSRGGDTYSNYIDLDNNGFGAPGAFQTASKGDKIILWGGGSNDAEARIGFSLDDSVWVKAMGTAVPNAFAVHGAAANSGSPNRLFTITKTGAVGIGTATPGSTLDINGDCAVANTKAYQVKDSGGTVRYAMYMSGSLSPSAGNDLFIGNTLANSLVLYTNSAERARIDSSGRLLVGTSTAPTVGVPASATFVVQGYAGVPTGDSLISLQRGQAPASISSGAQLGAITFGANDGSPYAQIHAATDGAGGTSDYPGRLVFSTTADGASSPTERMRIGNDGAITAGSSGASITGASHSFYATANTASTYAAAFRQSGSTGSGRLLYWNLDQTNDSTAYFVYAVNSTINCFEVRGNGDVKNTNNSYGAVSDIKLKENIVDANSQWDDLKSLRVRNYNFKKGPTHAQIGLIAQEVELISPGLVNESPDRDEDGNDLGTVTKSVNYSVLYMKAVKALQEAMERIETLEAKVATLEAN
jgi:hypothetical protein